jgi:hypothetical protein
MTFEELERLEWHRRFKEGELMFKNIQDMDSERAENEQRYVKLLKSLWKYFRIERPKLKPDKWILHYDIVPVHDGLRLWEFVSKKCITKMYHTPYSPDLAPCDFWLFPKLKNILETDSCCLLTSKAT